MAVKPHTIDIVVADMSRAMGFYRCLGLDAPANVEGQDQAEIHTPGCPKLGFLSKQVMKQSNPHWINPVGQRVTFACMCDNAAEVDAVYARVTGAGYVGLKEPWDAFWGQRYAFLQDPDGNRVDLFAPIAPEGEEVS